MNSDDIGRFLPGAIAVIAILAAIVRQFRRLAASQAPPASAALAAPPAAAPWAPGPPVRSPGYPPPIAGPRTARPIANAAAPAPAASRPVAPAARTAPVAGLARLLSDPVQVRTGIVLAEILGPPRALR